MITNLNNPIKLLLWLLVLILSAIYVIFWFKRRKIYAAASKIKGPFAFPLIGAAYKWMHMKSTEEFLKILKENFEKYGPIMKLWAGPYLLICCSKPADMEIIMNSTKCLDKSIFYNHVRPFSPFGIGNAKLEPWKKNRKILHGLLNNNGLVASFFGKMSFCAEEIVERITEINNTENNFINAKNTCEIIEPVKASLVDIVCGTMFGINPSKSFTQKLYDFLCAYNSFLVKHMLQFWTYFDILFERTKMVNLRNILLKQYHVLIYEIIDMKKHDIMKNGLQLKLPKPFLESLIEEYQFSDEQLYNEISQLFFAGIDSTSTTINAVLMCLGIFPEIQEKVYEELMDVVGPNGKMNNADMLQLDYLERVMLETLRLFPVNPNISRVVTEELEITDGITLPTGAMLVLSIFHTHMNPEFWPDPWRFDPDRFLPQEKAKRHSYAYLAWATGIRNCIGIKYAKMNVKTYVGTILQKFRIECGYKSVQEVRQEIRVVNMPVLGYKLRFIKRELNDSLRAHGK